MKFGVYSGIDLYCEACKSKVKTLVVNGATIYPHRPDLYQKVFLQCPHCKNYTMADEIKSTDSFKTWERRHRKKTIPTATSRRSRYKIHKLIDPVWKSGIMSRANIYKRLSVATGVKNYHNGSLCDEEIERKAMKEAEKIYREAVVLGLDKSRKF